MPARDISFVFANPKERRAAMRLIGQFTAVHAFLPASIDLYRERGLGMQYRGTGPRSYFPTVEAWRAFVEFAKLIHHAEPFASRSTSGDTHAALVHAFADMLSARFLPETPEELLHYLPNDFKLALTNRRERAFCKAQGVSIEFDGFMRIGHCWLGKYRNLVFDAIPESPNGHKESSLRSLADCFGDDSAVIAAERNPGTSNRVALDSAYQCETALSILCLLLNLTYESAFGDLWQIRRVERPEDGLSKEFGFSIIQAGGTNSTPQLGMRMAFRKQRFKIDRKIVDMWHDSLGLGICNRLVTAPEFGKIELVGRLLKAIPHYRLAARQPTPEMQMSTLWICAESLLTGGDGGIANANLPGLLATTAASMRRDHWPGGATTPNELKSTFRRYYDQRSRAIHQGRRGHVSPLDVQEFSVVVGGLIVNVVRMIPSGVRTINDMSVSFQGILDRLQAYAAEGN